ncbi:hypothetical protein [Mycobacterium sp.]|uniref:hypothetical protein n=1 Tax=Mycobacterium sp. TaxID=1785 RepID=UPI003F9848B4
MSEEAALFDASLGGSAKRVDGLPVECRLERFADLAKESTQLAGKIRTNLSCLADSARLGGVANAHSQVDRLTTGVAELKALVDRLAIDEQSLGLRGVEARLPDYADELHSALVERGVTVVKGPDPYWLAYPAWFKVERSAKGNVEVVLNGDRLDTLRPSLVADRVAEAIEEKFDAKQFTGLLVSVRQLFRRAGAAAATLPLEDVYEVLALEPGGRVSRRKDFSKATFYYSVHRLAEELDQMPDANLTFPAANRSNYMFFNRRGEGRRYLTVNFAGGAIN